MEAPREGGNVFVRIPISLKPTANRPSTVLLTKANTTWRVQLCMSDTRHLCTDLPSHQGEREICCWGKTAVHTANTNSLPPQQTWCLCQKSLSVPFLILPSFIHEDGGGGIFIGIRQPPAARSLAVISILFKPFHNKLIEKDSGLLKLPNTIFGDFSQVNNLHTSQLCWLGKVIISSPGSWSGIKGSGINYGCDLCQELSSPWSCPMLLHYISILAQCSGAFLLSFS